MNGQVDYSRNQVEQLARLSAEVKSTNLALSKLNERLASMEKGFKDSSNASGKLSLSLNFLTGALVLVGLGQIAVTYFTK